MGTKHKVSELDDIQLNAAVAKAMGLVVTSCDEIRGCRVKPSRDFCGSYFAPSAFWEHGGPIIERERIELRAPSEGFATWHARSQLRPVTAPHMAPCYAMEASTPLVAAMRCFVASKLGAEVELP